MEVFGNYSRYYDLLYRDKDYRAEAAYVRDHIRRHDPHARSILELGCGTGAHAQHLAAFGFEVHGVDLSQTMLERAFLKNDTLPPDVSGRVAFSQGDVRAVRLDRKFDSVVSLFHVMSYQIATSDLLAAFVTAKHHLSQGGIFIFDCWYGPAVLTCRPSVRVKRLEDDAISVIRIAEPVMHPNDNVVDVNYSITIRDKASGRVEELKETHCMRYLFRPEVELLAAQTGFEIIESQEWMTGKAPGFDTWGVCFVGRG